MSGEVVVELLKDLEVKISQADMYMKKTPSAENKDLYRKVLNEAIRLIDEKAILKEFYKNIKSYGGIQKLFKSLNKISPEYADKIEQLYIKAIKNSI